eukprot:TRINITY_DN272_c1_g2_i1.p1 TRINITY_DN272_c1_g2~~TRINITY_DN272_c1_g2_i1.p1  ORF type:complete len:627 (+),score=101.54 TRINITY_DN272_c1_g2_i1:37-1881(+)
MGSGASGQKDGQGEATSPPGATEPATPPRKAPPTAAVHAHQHQHQQQQHHQMSPNASPKAQPPTPSHSSPRSVHTSPKNNAAGATNGGQRTFNDMRRDGGSSHSSGLKTVAGSKHATLTRDGVVKIDVRTAPHSSLPAPAPSFQMSSFQASSFPTGSRMVFGQEALHAMTEIATGASSLPGTEEAMRAACRSAFSGKTKKPGILLVYATVLHDPAVLLQVARELAGPACVICGCSTSQCALTERGVCSSETMHAMAVWACFDETGRFGAASAQLPASDDNYVAAADAGADATSQALTLSRVDGPPKLVWLHCAPGCEEAVLAGVERVVAAATQAAGTEAPAYRTVIAGGSSADNSVSGKWWQLCNEQYHRNAVVVCVIHTDADVYPVFDSCYTATAHSAVITRSEGRVIFELDGKPASEVYNRWTGFSMSDTPRPPPDVYLAPSTVFPLGRFVGTDITGSDVYSLMHPHRMENDGSLSLFANVGSGSRVSMMAANTRQITREIGARLAQSLRKGATFRESAIVGSLLVYCAGCMMHVRAEGMLDTVAQQIKSATNHAPFLCLHPFGEQGRLPTTENSSSNLNKNKFVQQTGHGNLMYSAVVFGFSAAVTDVHIL